MVTGVSTLASALVHPPAHAAIETRHHTLAELAPRPVVAGLAPACVPLDALAPMLARKRADASLTASTLEACGAVAHSWMEMGLQ